MDNKQFAEWLRALELAQVTLTATIDPSGRLGPVGGLWPKLLAAAKEAAMLGLLRAVVVAEEQPDVPKELEKDDTSSLRVTRAATLQEAVQKLYEEQGPREAVRRHERVQCASIDLLGRSVPFEKHYQLLPLLREVKRERLPRHPRAPEREEAPEPQLRPVDILRWEEELREERVTYERVSLEQVFTDFQSAAKGAKTAVPGFVVLGPPGSGKTTLVQYLGWQAANGTLHVSGRPLLPVRVRLREWEAWATKEADPQQRLPQYLTERYKDLPHAPSTAQWQRWLQKGEVLLLLDGLDEIEGKSFFLSALKTALLTFEGCPTMLTCRTVSFEQHRALCPDFPIFTLAGLDTAQRDAFIRTFPAEHPDRYEPDALIAHLNRTPQLLALAANPLLLNVICYVVDDARGSTLPATRGALYQKALEKLLTRRPQRVEVRYPGEEPSGDEKLAILQRTALNLFAQGDRRLTFTAQELGQGLKQALSEEGYGEAPAPWANALRVDFSDNSGILRGSPTQGSFFLHLTIQEFLAAGAIARIINEKGWEAPITIAGTKGRVRHLVGSKAWDPRWQEVILLLAGQLRDPVPLLMLLADEKRDDVCRCRLALAALCLPEVRSTLSDNQSAIVDRITTAAMSCWVRHERNSTDAAVPHLTRALPALGQVNGHMEGAPLLQWLCQRLRDPDGDVRSGAAEAVGQIGEAVTQHSEVLSGLVVALHDRDELVRAKAAEAFRRVGAAAARHPEVPPALVQAALHDTDWFVRSGAVRALEQLGAAAAQHPALLPAMEAALHDEHPQVRSRAADLLRQLGAAPQPPELPAALAQMALHDTDQDADVRAKAADAVEQLGATAPHHPMALLTLVQVALHDKDGLMRARAASALEQLGATAAQYPAVLPALVPALHDVDGDVRARAARILEQLGAVATERSEVLPTLVEVALHDTDGGVRAEAADALAQIAAVVTGHPPVLRALVQMTLHDTDAGVRARAARALGQMGKAAARHPEVLAALVAALRDEDSTVRLRAAEALGQMMAQGVRVFQRRRGKVEGKSVEELATLKPV